MGWMNEIKKWQKIFLHCHFNSVYVLITELKDDRIKKYGSLFVFISKEHCRATLKNLLADGRGGWVAEGRLCKSRVASFLYFREIFVKFLISCYAKFSSNFAKLEINNFAKILQNYKNENFTATLCTIGVRGVGGEQVQPGRTLCAKADCALFIFLLYHFPFCHLLILWFLSEMLANSFSQYPGGNVPCKLYHQWDEMSRNEMS